METKSRPYANPEGPDELNGLYLSKPSDHAVGFPAVLSSFQHLLKEMGPLRAFRAMAKLNQHDGFDCPGCAWPDPDDERSRLGEYCENGAKAIAEEATTRALWADFFARNSVADLAALDDYTIGKMGRIAEPVYLPEGASHYQPISWEDAFRKIAAALNALNSPHEAVFYTSGRTSNEAAFLYQLFVRAFGTNNLPDCSNMCHESSGVALGETLGIGKGSVTLEDFYEAEAILILGQNPGTNHPRMLSALKKAADKGAYIVSINPLEEAGLKAFADPQTVGGLLGATTKLASLHLPVKINGDMALVQALVKLLLEAEEKHPGQVLDNAFIAEHTAGFETYQQHINTLHLNELSFICGIPIPQIQELAEALTFKKKIIICWAMGLTQHKNAVDTIKELVNLLLIKGSIGKPGAGTCPVRGHSNVQGDRTMGIYEKPWPWLLTAIEQNYGFTPPARHGYDVVEAIHAMQQDKVHVFIAMGGNFLSATPDTRYTAEGLRKIGLTVQVSTKLNRSHLVTGKEAIILPTLGRSDKDLQNGIEQFVSCENSMGVVQQSKGNLQPVSKQLKSEVAIVSELANATFGTSSGINWLAFPANYDLVRTEIERTIPGFDRYNERVRERGGFYLPNSSRDRSFPTDTFKANFTISRARATELKPGELMMMTIRSHDQYNTTIYGLDDRYRGIQHERRVILMNEKDMQARGLKKLDQVDLYNFHEGRVRIAHRFLVIPYAIPEQCCATYFPETNVLVPINSVADKSNTPTSKLVIIELKKTASA